MAALLPLRRCRWAWPAGFHIRWRKNCADSMHKSWVVCGYLYQIPSKSLFEATAISDGTGGTQPNQTGHIGHPNPKPHKEVFTERAFTHRSFYTKKSLHRGVFTHRRICTQKLSHSEAFTQRVFTHGSFYTQKLLHREVFAQRRLYTK